jgi:polyisoprenoid-binding protein YceI
MYHFRHAWLSLAALSAVTLVGHAKLKDAGDVDIEFHAIGPGGMKINGKAPGLTAAEDGGKLTASVPAAKLDTGIKLRDKHLREYLEAEKCPQIALSVDRQKLQFPEEGKELSAEATGTFTLHCQTKPLKFKYTAKRTGSDYHVSAVPASDIDIRDYGVKVPSYLGVSVKPHVRFSANFKLRDE